jgi:hypothetical protein
MENAPCPDWSWSGNNLMVEGFGFWGKLWDNPSAGSLFQIGRGVEATKARARVLRHSCLQVCASHGFL